MIIKTGEGTILDVVEAEDENLPTDEKVRKELNDTLVDTAKKEIEGRNISALNQQN